MAADDIASLMIPIDLFLQLTLFDFTTLDDLRRFLKIHKSDVGIYMGDGLHRFMTNCYAQFQKPLGAILFLYSVVLSRTPRG